jgi:hypothetical protein
MLSAGGLARMYLASRSNSVGLTTVMHPSLNRRFPIGCKRKWPRLIPLITVASPLFAFHKVNHFV